MESPNYEVVSSGTFGSTNRDWSIRRGTFREGLASGVEVIEIRQGDFSFKVFPTRGMGIWEAHVGSERIGWDSPVKTPVHPAFINVKARNGLGWLDGFNELLCRCGLSFNGPPGKDEAVGSAIESDVTLHGNIANLPAHSIQFIETQGEIGVSGIVDESTLFGPQLRLKSIMTTRCGENAIVLRDMITNLGSRATDLSLLYHTNIGSPILEEGARLSLPVRRVVPNHARSAEDVATYDTYLGPTPEYSEQVYFFETLADAEGHTVALLENQAGTRGFSMSLNTFQLPYFTQWKCTQPLQDGYVTGLEPGTNFPNFKAFEREQGRILQLAPGASYEIELTLSFHTNSEEIQAVKQKIVQIQSQAEQVICPQPISPFCRVE